MGGGCGRDGARRGYRGARDEKACRSIAVRHADDHIHIGATLARLDGRHPRVRGDNLAMHTGARSRRAGTSR